eukprot:NODE_32725_length_340_cov_15.314554.p4 GENE.NODE_32725_length_340_cov_15.314554~~NODE_32725_length_340_cov_15.314554.p4  ORF type:complete len:53 (-),score=7.81 NODE_32725_length_340_cov_15.314554:46-204(-)
MALGVSRRVAIDRDLHLIDPGCEKPQLLLLHALHLDGAGGTEGMCCHHRCGL